MPKPFVVSLRSRHLKVALQRVFPKEQISEAVQIYRSYYKEGILSPTLLNNRVAKAFAKLPYTSVKNTPTAHDMIKIWESIISLIYLQL